jgi:voltage-dependent calcium channel alpha-2/delta-3
VNDPIFIPIEQLEQDKDGRPAKFSDVVKDMKAGRTGSLTVPRARKGKGKVIQTGNKKRL